MCGDKNTCFYTNTSLLILKTVTYKMNYLETKKTLIQRNEKIQFLV